MRRKLFYLVLVCPFSLCCAVTLAQTKPSDLAVKIPFDFMIGRRMFVEGDYSILFQARNAVLRASHGIAASPLPSKSLRPAAAPLNLVFDHSGYKYKLVEVSGRPDIGRMLTKYKAHKVTIVVAEPAHLATASAQSDSGN